MQEPCANFVSIQILYDKRSLIIHNQRGDLDSQQSNQRYLVLGDLHIGFEEKFSDSGIKIQSNYLDMAREIVQIVEQHNVTSIVVNGDLKSGKDRILQSEWENVPKFLSTLSSKCHVFMIPGNHDGGLSHLFPNNAELLDSSGLQIEENLILHGHTRPIARYSSSSRIIMGHVHPIFQRKGSPLSGQPLWIFAKVPRKSIFRDALLDSSSDDLVEVIIMPSFNKDLSTSGYATEITKEERRVSPMVREVRNSREAMISTLNGEIIGDSTMLSNLL